MEEVKQRLLRYKGQMILLGVIGIMLAPFLWPFYLAIVFQALSLLLPVLIAGTVIRKIRKEKVNEQKRNDGYPCTENSEFCAEKAVPGGTCSEREKTAQTDPVQKKRKEAGAEQLRKNRKRRQEMSDAACIALMWYQLEGRERIFRIMRKLETEGKLSFSISPEGICSVREKDGFQRIGALRAYPHGETKILVQELRKDHIRAVQKGKYLWLSWGKGGLR